jgi:hypothetical protein
MMSIKKPLLFTVSLSLAGCAGMSQQQQSTATGAVAGTLLGALVGGLAGGGKGAAIGAGAGALLGGIAGYVLAPDRLTQSVTKTGNQWQQDFSAQQTTRVTPVVLANGQQAQQVDEMRLTVPSSRMVSKQGKLSKDGQAAIEKLIVDARQNGGSVSISYPAKAPKAVINTLLDTGVTVQKSDDLVDQYAFVILRSEQKPVPSNASPT